MGFLGQALLIILGIVVLVLIVKLIVFLFTNFVSSRIISIIFAIAALIMAFTVADKGIEGNYWTITILTTLSYIFLIGPVIFDVDWDGSYDVTITDSTIEFTPRTTGGLLFHTLLGLLVIGGIYLALGTTFTAVFFLLPILVLLANGGLIIMMVRS